jgi:hypothetical protein
VNEVKIAGFTAEASLEKTSGRYQYVATRAYCNGEQKVIPQLPIDPFPVSNGIGAFGDFGNGLCRGVCDVLWALCLEDCEGTPENPKVSTNSVICDQNHQACLKICG